MSSLKPIYRWAVSPHGRNVWIPASEGRISTFIAAEANEEPTKPEVIPEEMDQRFSPQC